MKLSNQILGLLCLLVNWMHTYAKPTPNLPLDKLEELNTSILELQFRASSAWKTMDRVWTNKGYPPRSSLVQCNLPTYLLYKSSAYFLYNATTLHQHLKKIKNTIRPLFDATRPPRHFKDMTEEELKKPLNVLVDFMIAPLRYLHRMNYSGCGNIIFNRTKLTEHARMYMKCANIAITHKSEQFLRHVIFIEAVDIALNDLSGDVSFIRRIVDKAAGSKI